jgi:cytochrome c553
MPAHFLLIACLTLLLTAMVVSGCERRYRIPAVTDVTESGLPTPFPDLENAAIDGKRLFLTNCAICHGHEGLGDGPSRSTLIVSRPTCAIDRLVSDGKTLLSDQAWKDGQWSTDHAPGGPE